jgi:hypothetical protein
MNLTWARSASLELEGGNLKELSVRDKEDRATARSQLNDLAASGGEYVPKGFKSNYLLSDKKHLRRSLHFGGA